MLDDVQQEKLSVGHVREEYGVVIDPNTLELDLKATDDLRARLRVEGDKDGC